MKLSTLLTEDRCLPGMQARDLRGCIIELLDKAARRLPEACRESALEAVLLRESQAPTAYEAGVAIPHARIPKLPEVHLFLGVPAEPLSDTGLDGEPISVVFLLVGGDRHHVQLLQSMAAISQLGLDGDTTNNIRAAESAEALWHVVAKSGLRVKSTLEARDVMGPVPFVARPTMTLAETLDGLVHHHAVAAPVCGTDGNVVGVITSREIIESGFPEYMAHLPNVQFLSEDEPFEQFFHREESTQVGEVADPNPVVVQAGDPLIAVVFQLRQERHRFACVMEDHELVGLINRDDLLAKVLRA
jgi:PTS system nitrogen regulatory IIA component